MAFVKRTWLARIGTGLNKFIIGEKDANDKQTLVNSPDSVTQQGDVISADNLNDLEERIETAVNANETAIQANATAIAGLKLTKVWENPDPSQAFNGPVVIDLGVNVSDIVIEYAYNTSYQGITQFQHWRTTKTSASLGGAINMLEGNGNTINVVSRPFGVYITSGTTKVYIDQATIRVVGTSSTVNNSSMIPIAIYAVGDIYTT